MNEQIKHKVFNMKRAIVMLSVAFVMALCIGATNEVFAAGGIDWGTSVKITQSGQVVDSITVNGKKVNAVYAPKWSVGNYDGDATYCCAAFVKKFYKNVYGVDVWNLYPGNVPAVSVGSFSKTASPKVGDIAANSGHWAIVKAVSDGKVTIIEQNAWDNAKTCAKVGRVLYQDSGYWYYRWSGNGAATNKSAKTATAKAKPKASFGFNIQPVKTMTTNAVIYTKVNNPGRVHVQQVGCRIYDSAGKLITTKTEKCSRKESVFNVWYDINSELGMKLSSKTRYQYEFFIDYGGSRYVSKKQEFTTK